jgi:uncharacterized protein (UPF0264 family)
MAQPCPTAEKTGLLVSVRNAEEATIAHSAECVSIIDLKEPNAGSLGNVPFDIAKEICSSLPLDSVKSIALGEATDGPVWQTQDLADRTELIARFQFAKIGLAGLGQHSDWVLRWRQCFEVVPTSVQRVAVAYADSDAANSPPIESIIESATEVGCSVFLIDTYEKGQGGLLDLLSIEQLTTFIRSAKDQHLKVVLAGSLKQADIATVKSLSPDLIAVRGAVCKDDRTSAIELTKIQTLAKLIGHLNVSD